MRNLILLLASLPLIATAATPTPERQAALLHLLKQDCGSCHGMTLQGGLGSPLTSQALEDRPPESLVQTILQGRPGTAMPPWNTFISEDEARWLVEMLQQGKIP
ncbi:MULTISPECIES: c-type cytochrome [Leeia]|uniref:Cytochrome c n=1 Tax=Leeia aquatica TaxID=2725557 RepID=A0A847SCI3_9NEIS|nr:cytochrome c [Leeia aquatica]NLR75196.1 cytochrome c [Leeia aquatica]